MSLPRAFDGLLASWPELAGFAGSPLDSAALSSLSPQLAHDRIEALEHLASVAADAHDAELLRTQAELFGGLYAAGRWRLNPDVLSEWSALLLRQTLAAQSSRREALRLEGLLASIPAHLPPGREGREQPDGAALELALETARGVGSQVEALAPLCSPSAVRAAASAIADQVTWLEGLVPGADLQPLGAESCEDLFRRRALGITPAELLDRAKEEVARCRAELPPELGAARRAIRTPAATSFQGVLAALGASLETAQAVAASAGLPEVEAPRLEVMATPAALRSTIPGAAVFTPRALAPGEATLVVLTESDDLADYSAARLANLAVHEGHPGHGLQAALANAAQRPWRAVDLCPILGLGAGLFACELMEGWAHFAEERLAEAGFHDQAERRFVQLDEALWRAVRARVDLGVNLGELDSVAAMRCLVEEAGLGEAAARAELDDYRLQPTYGLSYLWGKLELRRMRTAWRGAEADLYRALLSEGLAPLAMSEQWLIEGGG